VSAEAEPDRVRLVWSTEELERATVERRESQGDWKPIADLVTDASRRLAYEDLDVVPGARYHYRLAVPTPGGTVHLGQTEVLVPNQRPLALDRAVWNAGSREFVFSVSLPHATPATLEVYDVNGRRWTTRLLEVEKAGAQEIRVGGSRSPHPGMYFATITQGEGRVSRSFTVLQ
jgi:hypothetical protein